MILDLGKRRLIKARVIYDLSPVETRIISLLSNQTFNSIKDIRTFCYKNAKISDEAIKQKVTQTRDRYHLVGTVNNYGARFRSEIEIRE